MDLIIYTLKSVAIAIVEPLHLLMLIIMGIMFYIKNRRISIVQKMTIGESLNSPLELTLSQIVLGIIAGALGSLILSILGISFYENSGIEFVFMISILMLFYKPKFVDFAYSSSILAIFSLVINTLSNLINKKSFITVDILSLMIFIGVIYVIQGVLIIVDGSRGAIPVFTSKEGKIIGGFSLNRYWALPIAVFMIFSGQISAGTTMNTPNWWPIINHTNMINILATAMIAAIPFYGVIGFSAVTFTKKKKEKTLSSGLISLIYGISVIGIAQLSRFGMIGQILTIVYVPLAYEGILRYQKRNESKGDYIYVSDEEGISVLEVAPSSPAFEAGIRRGDKIIAINDEEVKSEIDIFKIAKDSIFKLRIKIKKDAGNVVEYLVQPKNKRLGILLVPKMVNHEDIVGVGSDDLKKILEDLRDKK